MDGRWHGDLRAVALPHHGDHFFDVERVPPRGRGDALASPVVQLLHIAEQVLDQVCTFVGGQGLEQQGRRVELPSAPIRPVVEQLGARDAEQKDRCVPREVGDVLDEIDEHGFRPLQIVDDADLRPVDGTRLPDLPEGDPRLLGSRGDDALGLDADRGQDLDERPVCNALPVGKAATAQHVGGVAGTVEEVCDEPRFPDPRGPSRVNRRQLPSATASS